MDDVNLVNYRIEKLEKELSNLIEETRKIKVYFNCIFGVMISVKGVLLGLMAKGFNWI